MPPQKTQRTPLQELLRTARPGFVFVGVFSFFLNLLMMVVPLYMMQVYDRVLASGSTETLVMVTIIAAVALAALGTLEAMRSQVLTRVSTWLDQRLSGRLIGVSLAAKLGGAPMGAQALRDLGQVRAFVSGQGIFPLFDSPWVPIYVAVIWLIHTWLGVLAAIAAVILFLMALANELVTRALLKDAGQKQVRALRQVTTVVDNAEVVQAMGMLPGLTRRYDELNDQVLAIQRVASDRASGIVGVSKFFRLFVQVGILGLGALLVIRGELTGGGMIAGSILLGRALAPVEQAITAWKSFVAARDGYARLQDMLLRLPTEREAMDLPAPQGYVVVDRVSFVPPGAAKPVLKVVSMDASPGQAVGIIGPSASGKSTLCRLIVGIWPPSAGSVRLDAADVHAWDRAALGRHIGYLPQDVELFAGTVKDNIARMGNPDAEAVVAAAQLAGVHEMILHLPEGYETEIGEGGAMLSGGQRQRIGLARALFGDPRLIVLDEPNSNLDPDGEAALLRAVAQLKAAGCTIIMVAHRPSILTHVDKVVMLRDGAVELAGSRDEVLRQVTARPVSVPRVTGGDAAAGPPEPPPNPRAAG
ncbi:MAG: type I secretion system permease/ATPase [Rhodospirillaceae bacterium]|nr:type I secretion system permease/ATPase [Rhodospirillaceae bacterium]